MLNAYISLSRLNADCFTAWVLLVSGSVWSRRAAVPGNPDLTTLGLDRMPPSDADLRRAYHHAAKAAHPDAGGSADAFRAVSEAFQRLASPGALVRVHVPARSGATRRG